MIREVLGLLLVVAAGHGVLRLLAGRDDWPFGIVGGLAFSYLSGTVLVGLSTTWLAVFGLPVRPAAHLIPLVAIACAGLNAAPPRLRWPSPAGVLAALAGGWLAFAASNGRVLLNDEYAIWALRGRALALAGGLEKGLFANPDALYAHLDYPLLVPAVIAWADGSAGHTADGSAHLYVALLAAALLGVVAWAAETLSGRWAAAVAVLLVATTGGFGANALRLMADVPVAAFSLAMALLLLVWMRDRDPRLLRVAAVMAAGAWATKNEGALFVLAAVIGVAVAARRWWPLAVAGVAFVANLPWFVWLRLNDISNDIVNAGAGDRVGDVGERAGVIARAFADAWPGSLPLVLLLVVAAVVAARRSAAHLVAVLVTVVLSVLGLAAPYVVTIHDLDGHLGASADRVLLFPALLVAVAVPVLGTMARDPQPTKDTGGP